MWTHKGIKMIKVFIDGACEPINPGGTASYGMVVYRDDKKIFTRSAVVGTGDKFTNNVAEYCGLLEFLRLWHGIDPAIVYSDSQLVINQMTGKWRVNSGLYVDYCLKCRDLIKGKPITFEWIPREKNGIADALSKKILTDKGIRSKEWK